MSLKVSENASELYTSVTQFQKDNVELTDRYRILLNDLHEANERLLTSEMELSKNADALVEANKEKEALSLLDVLGVKENSDSGSFEYSGRSVDKLSRSQKYRITRTLKTKMEKALWFAESYGLRPSSIKLFNSNDEPVTVQLDNSDPSDDIERMKEILFILDKFKISDSAYHEIVIKTGDLPKLHSIVNIREKTNEKFEIYRTPGNVPGAYVSLKAELTNIIRNQPVDNQNKLQIKISGDDTRITRISNFIVISFSVLTAQKLSADEQKVLAIVKSSENYECLSACLSPLFSEINELYANGHITVGDKTYNLDIFFGADMKFIQICLGLGGSTGDYACPWCKVHKSKRGDITKQWDFYHLPEHVRTIKEIRDLYNNGSKASCSFGVKHMPLISIEPQHVIPDELHLFMRIFDILLRNLIDDVISKDDEAKTRKEKGGYLDSLVKSIRECGVSFSIWSTKGRNERDWTSLTGNEMKRVAKNLPDKIMFIVHNETHDDTVKLWKTFWKLYKFVCSDEVERRAAEQIFVECKIFLDTFLKLGFTERKGYADFNVTPYMHCLVYHVPYFVSHFGTLKKFSGQPTEKINDNVKAVFHLKTNHHDCAIDAIKVQKRLEVTSHFERSKRNYMKTDDEYWDNRKRMIHEHKKRKILDEIIIANVENSQTAPLILDEMTENELKQKLKENGVNTKVRKREKLIDMLKSVLSKTNS